jgi:hypothetical protein
VLADVEAAATRAALARLTPAQRQAAAELVAGVALAWYAAAPARPRTRPPEGPGPRRQNRSPHGGPGDTAAAG